VLRSANRAPIAAELGAWCAARTVDEVIAAGASHDVPMGRVRRPRDVLSAGVLLDRGFFRPRHSDLGPISVPSLPFGRGAGGRVDRPGPRLSAD
jgi:crotonobetainyl-CoA:carnitine CoA-transferase CaiB-like acyl-CoA transferase